MQNNHLNNKADGLHFFAGRELMANSQIQNYLYKNILSNGHSILVLALLYFILILFTFPTFAVNERNQTEPALVSAWAKLDQARSYRVGWRDNTLGKTHSQLVEAYTTELDCAGETITAQACF